MIEDLSKIRKSLKIAWKDSAISLSELSRDLDMPIMTLRRFLINEKPIDYKNYFKIRKYLLKKSPESK